MIASQNPHRHELSLELISAGSTQKQYKHEDQHAFLARISHVTVTRRGITNMQAIEACSNLAALFLYDNKIEAIQGLHASHRHLTRLYLQNNNIETISGLDCGLGRLSVLNLSGNRIQLATGLHNLPALEELHLDKQRLAKGQSFDMDLDSIAGLSLEHMAATFQSLRTLKLTNNPIQDRYLRQHLVLTCRTLEWLDDKAITDTERLFLMRMEASKAARARRTATCESDGAQTAMAEAEESAAPPIPHLPPYATQYRYPLMLDLCSTSRTRLTCVDGWIGRGLQGI
ncbi:hypothetical protein BC831DRAFT_400188 [Entophlyctis helioformis]|nr:hypothetical protein BC831DRAFT_400188 [Entophlyctis helioformis]